MNDAGRQLIDEEAMDGVDVRPLPRTKAEMMETGSILVEGYFALRRRRAANEDARPSADTVENVLTLDERLQAEEVAELLPEGEAAFRILHAELNVGDPVHLDAHRFVSFAPAYGIRRHAGMMSPKSSAKSPAPCFDKLSMSGSPPRFQRTPSAHPELVEGYLSLFDGPLKSRARSSARAEERVAGLFAGGEQIGERRSPLLSRAQGFVGRA
jgi:hypothetical protein